MGFPYFMKKLLIVAFSTLSLGLLSCGGRNSDYPQQHNNVTFSPMGNNVNIQADQNNAAFDVSALSQVVQRSTDPKVLEQKINDPDNKINNLDLDKDGKIDYLNVTEAANNQLTISDASVDPAVTVANLTITPDQQAQTASMQIQGTPAYCGSYNTYYQPHISFGEILFLSYLMRPHSYYYPMYGYHNYPSYYTSRRTVVRNVYHPTQSSYVRNGNSGGGFNSGRSGSRSSMSAPTSSQRSFGVRDNSRAVGSGGFGNASSRRSYSSPSPSRSSFSSGGSRRSFGRRR